MPSTTPILDLSAPIAQRASVLIPTVAHPEGEHFELRGELELGIVKIQTIATLFQKVADIQASDAETTIADAEQMERWLDEMFDEMFYRPVDSETRAAIPDMRKMRVIQFFLDVCFVPAAEQAGAETTPPKKRQATRTPIGAK